MVNANGTSAMVALIKATTCEPVESRRLAASMLLDALRSATCVHDLREAMARMADEVPRDVTGDIFDLVEQLGLGGPADLLP